MSTKTAEGLGYTRVTLPTKEIGDQLYRVNIVGDQIYPITNEVNIYSKEGIEFVILEDMNSARDFIDLIKNDFEFVYPFAAYNADKFEEIKVISQNASSNYLYKRNLDSVEQEVEEAEEIDKKTLIEQFSTIQNLVASKLARRRYISWKKSNYLMAARIPSQALQSLMSMQNVAYIQEAGNNVYVSHWQLLLQGSDFDIDKAYAMMYDFKNGIYRGWSPNFDYTSERKLALSEKLPIPNGVKYSITEEEDAIDLIEIYNNLLLAETVKYIKLEDVVTILNLVKTAKSIKVPKDDLGNLILKTINDHNKYSPSPASLKNLVVRNIIETSRNPKNQLASFSPIDFGKLDQVKEETESDYLLSLMDGISMDRQQEINAVGQDVIGIAANGIKDYFALTTYLTGFYNQEVIEKRSNEYFERTFTITDGIPVKINRIAGLNIEQRAVNILNDYINTFSGIENLFDYDSDPALVLSSLLSAATDNAKELILKAINAGKQFASMHIYLIILGFDVKAVADYMTRKEHLVLEKELEGNVFTKKVARTINSVLKDDETPAEFEKIYYLSDELTFLASMLKINQAGNSSPESLYIFFQNLQKGLKGRQKQFFKDVGITEIEHLTYDKVITDKLYLADDHNYVMSTILSAKTEGISEELDFVRYFSDETYRDMVINYYNIIKGTFNVFDILYKSPHFGAMIDASIEGYNQLKARSKKFDIVVEVMVPIIEEEGVNIKEDHIAKAFGVFDDIIISEWFKKKMISNPISMRAVATLTNTIPKYFDPVVKQFRPLNEDILIDFSNDVHLVNFKQMMENNILPYLKSKYENNSFISGLLIRSRAFERDRT